VHAVIIAAGSTSVAPPNGTSAARVCDNGGMGALGKTLISAFVWAIVCSTVAGAQPVPQPFPRPGTALPPPPGDPPPAAPAVSSPNPDPAVPDEALLGVPLYPNAQFIGSFDAGRGQRYYLFGLATPFADAVMYYRNVLKNRGEVVFEEPPVHMFETGRFREEAMAFPPSVTVKDYTWGGSQGYLLALAGGKSQRFATVVQIVPVPPGERR
jgi:hypothetical protein